MRDLPSVTAGGPLDRAMTNSVGMRPLDTNLRRWPFESAAVAARSAPAIAAAPKAPRGTFIIAPLTAAAAAAQFSAGADRGA
ncbi:unnamed protein product [Lampetra fluviatilis]